MAVRSLQHLCRALSRLLNDAARFHDFAIRSVAEILLSSQRKTVRANITNCDFSTTNRIHCHAPHFTLKSTPNCRLLRITFKVPIFLLGRTRFCLTIYVNLWLVFWQCTIRYACCAVNFRAGTNLRSLIGVDNFTPRNCRSERDSYYVTLWVILTYPNSYRCDAT